MKKIFKLFPAALAVVALSSCSNDELPSFNDVAELNPNFLYVTVEGEDEGLTRGGFSEKVTEDGIGRQIIFEEGDVIKLYDNENNWRPQEWAYDPTATADAAARYRDAAGVKLFSKKIKATGENQDQYSNGYGVFPPERAYFENEDRNKLMIDLSDLGYIEYKRTTGKGSTADSTEYRCPMPLWGVANEGRMTLKHLTAYLRIDIADVAAAAAGKKNVLVIQANKKLHQTFSAATATSVTFDPEAKTTAPVINAADMAIAPLAINTAYELATATCDNMIFVDLGSAALGQTVVYVPLVPGATAAKATLAKDAALTVTAGVVTHVTTANDAAKLQVIGEKDLTQVTNGKSTAGKFYRIANEAIYDLEDINTPWALAQAIMQKDAAADRDFTVNVNNVIQVENGSDPNKYLLNISTGLQHNVTINFTGGGFAAKTAGTDNLEVKTAQSTKKLTFNFKDGGDDLKNITFTAVNSPVTLTGEDVVNVVVNSENVTIANNVTTAVTATKPVTIDGVGKTIAALNVKRGATSIKLDNGIITNLVFDNGATTYVNNAVEVDANGLSAIKTVTNLNASLKVNIAGKSDNGQVTFKSSAWGGQSFASEVAAQIDQTAGNAGIIYTAAQLASIGKTADNAAYVVKAASFNLNNKDWTPVALDKSFDGGNVAITGLSVKTNAITGAGLFGTITAGAALTVKDFTISGAVANAGANDVIKNVGIVAGIVKTTVAATAVTFDNIDVTGSISSVKKSENLGGLIGSLDNNQTMTLTLKDVNIDDVEIKGYKGLGGFIGLVPAKATVVFSHKGTGAANNPFVYNTANDITFVSNIIDDKTVDAYATRGKFVGYAVPTDDGAADTYNAMITVEVEQHPAIGAAVGTPITYTQGCWNEMVKATTETIAYDIDLRQSYVGFSGVSGSDAGDLYHEAAITDADWGVTFTTLGATGAAKKYVPQIVKYAAATDAAKQLLFTIEK